MIEHMLDALSSAGVGPVGMVVGYCADEIKEVVGIRAEYIDSPRWATTNSMYSFALAREWISGPVLVLNCDLLLHPRIIERLLETGEDCFAYDSASGDGREQMAVKLENGILTDMSKELGLDTAAGENVGVLYLSHETAMAVCAAADRLVASGGGRDWLGSALREVASQRPIRGVDTRGLPWSEIDFANDLEHARKKVWPAIAGPGHKRAMRKRIRGRVVAASVVVLASTLLVNALFFQRVPDWDTVDISGGQQIHMSLGDRAQRWWGVATAEDIVFADVIGPDTIRIESRLILKDSVEESIPYVVEVRLDGKRHDWFRFEATPSKSARYGEASVSKKRRATVTVPDGAHTVSAVLLSPEQHPGLFRFRQIDPNDD